MTTASLSLLSTEPQNQPPADEDQASVTTELDHLPPYEYEPLASSDAVRVLCLEPADDESRNLQASFIHIQRYAELAKLGDYQRYSAVSYSWGKPHFTRRLLIKSNDGSKMTYISITENVEIMLQHLRKPHKSQYLWIDAICFNQKDNAEISQQIPLMGDIYRYSSKIYIWLGHENAEHAARVFAFLRLMANVKDAWSRPKIFGDPEDVWPRTMIFEDREDAGAQVGYFLRRDWFFRRWTLQEAAFARNGLLCCGKHRLSYQEFVAAGRKLKQNSLHLRGDAIDVTTVLSDTIRRIDGTEEPEYLRNIYMLLWKFHKASCSDKRDRIAALYGFLPHYLQLPLDYAASYQDIYKMHAVALGSGVHQHLLIVHMFVFGTIQIRDSGSVPSWIPDWSNERSSTIPLLFNPYEDKVDILTPGGVTDFHSRRCLERLYYPREALLNGHWIGDHFIPGHRFHRRRNYFRPKHGAQPPNTAFSIHIDNNNRHVLTAAWINPWAGKYGRLITATAAITGRFWVKNDLQEYKNAFQPIARHFGSSPKQVSSGKKLSFLLRRIMKESEDFPTKYPLEATNHLFTAMCYLFGTNPPSTIAGKGLPKPIHEIYQLTEGEYLRKVLGILSNLARTLHHNKLCIMELEDGDGCDYALGPNSLQSGMRLIPLASHLRPRSDIPEELERNMLAFSEEGEINRMAWSRHTWIDELATTNFLAIQCDTFPSNSERPNRETVMHKCGGRESDYISPIKATYAGPCVGVVSQRSMVIKYSDFQGLSQEHLEDIETKDWMGAMKEEYTAAQKQGLPPPYLIDIY